MRIETFTLDQPDGDGAMSTNLETIVENPTEETVRWIQSNAILVNDQGFPLACHSDNGDDCTLAPRDQFTQRHYLFAVPVAVVGATRDNVGCIVTTTLFARDFMKLGDVDVPKGNTGSTTIEQPVTTKVLDGTVKLMVCRQPPDDDGDIKIDCRVSFRSATDTHLARVELRTELLDQDECIVCSNADQIALPPRAVGCIEGGIGTVKSPQLRDAKLRLSLFVFRPICHMNCTGVSSPADS